ncbi:unnamed protein product [Somion occarium]|uniref:Mitochondrial import inner membrane translocase subunit TIM50 n=1 Tax=Somion occarium TaxID=3059160 RepID=A0ABP1D1D1_9APHY
MSGYYPNSQQSMFPARQSNLSYIPHYGFVDTSSRQSSSRARQNIYRDHEHYSTDQEVHSEGDYWQRPPPPPSPPRRAPKEPKAYREHDDRPVTPPPSQKPSKEYLSIASQPPSTFSDSDPLPRKLLILDLNGTLLHRSSATPPNRHKQRTTPWTDDRPRDSSGRVLPRLRPVHPRPYMPSFRNYLFAPETKKWLDAMIWSSAQPHSVNDMVDKTFGDTKDELLTIWARDTLGLSDEHYARKVQTFKDLTKPWAGLPSLLSPSELRRSPSPASSIASTQHGSPPPSSPLRSSSPSIELARQDHSALTTLLLDDSPRKAELQPYNHICIPEYDGARRAKDLQLLEAQREISREHEEEAETQQDVEEAAESASAQLDAVALEDTTAGVEDDTRKRKRKHKKKKRRTAFLATGRDPGSLESGYDPTLLAVIGVLDEVKRQANVAAWIHSGGLWGPPELNLREQVYRPAQTGEEVDTSLDSLESSNSEVSSGSDLSVKEEGPYERKEKKRQKKRSPFRPAQAEGVDHEGSSSPSAPPKHVGEGSGANQEPTDEATAAAGSRSPPAMWFEHMPTLLYWAARGKEVLEKMGIPIEHGIEK